MSKKEEELKGKLDWARDNGIDVEILVKSKVPFEAKIPGWTITRGPRKPEGKKLYRTNYKAPLHIQEFFDYLERHPRLKAIMVSAVQVEPKARKVEDDPSRYKYAMAVMSTEPFEFDIPKWIIAKPARRLRDIGCWYTIYHCPNPLWDDFINHVRKTKELDRITERMIPDTAKHELTREEVEEQKRLRQERDANSNRRIHATVTKNGIKATKYEYPPDCVSDEDRSRYRRKMRAKRRNGNG